MLVKICIKQLTLAEARNVCSRIFRPLECRVSLNNLVSTNQRLVLYSVNQSEISIVLYKPIRGEYSPASQHHPEVLSWWAEDPAQEVRNSQHQQRHSATILLTQVCWHQASNNGSQTEHCCDPGALLLTDQPGLVETPGQVISLIVAGSQLRQEDGGETNGETRGESSDVDSEDWPELKQWNKDQQHTVVTDGADQCEQCKQWWWCPVWTWFAVLDLKCHLAWVITVCCCLLLLMLSVLHLKLLSRSVPAGD